MAQRWQAPRKALRSRRLAVVLAVAATIGAVAAIGVMAFSGVWSSTGRKSLAAGRARSAPDQALGQGGSSHRASFRGAGAARGQTRSTVGVGAQSQPSPGSLPQTRAYPSAHSAQFKLRMASLWAGIVRDSARRALQAFFPRAAYVQLKAIRNAGSDWTGRLLRDYSLDISAAHALLGGEAAQASLAQASLAQARLAQARLVGVDVNSSYGHWIGPGVCYNGVGYYEMPGARIVYREAGGIHSFGIASMISWRGEWYVVHLGAVLRSADEGVVDEPSSGPGAPAYSGTC